MTTKNRPVNEEAEHIQRDTVYDTAATSHDCTPRFQPQHTLHVQNDLLATETPWFV